MSNMLERCIEMAPRLTAIAPNTVADIIERMDIERARDKKDTAGIIENLQSIISAGEAVASTSSATMHDIGAVFIERAEHAWFGVNIEHAREAVAAAQREQDAYTAQSTAVVSRKRTKKGTSTVVRRHGRALVIGDTYPSDIEQHAASSRVPACVIEHALQQTAHGVWHDGIGVARIATLAYNLPTLIGGETTSWSEVVPEEVSMLLDAATYAGWTTGPYGATRPNVKKRGARVALPAIRLRNGEQRSTVRFPRLSYASSTVRGIESLTSSGHDIEHAFHGHHAYTRPATYRAHRAARARKYDVVTFPADVDPMSLLQYLAADIERGAAVKFTTADRSVTGTLTRAAKGKLSISIPFHGVSVRVRTVAALLKAAAPAFA
jgi:hypothetical protein